MSTPTDVKRKASFEPGSAPPKKMALLASSHPDPSTPDVSAPDPKKTVSTAQAQALRARASAAPTVVSQAPSAHSSMNATVLQRQNLNLQTSLEQKRRDLEELRQKARLTTTHHATPLHHRTETRTHTRVRTRTHAHARTQTDRHTHTQRGTDGRTVHARRASASQLERTEQQLLTKENAISVLDRHWEQTEQQAAALLARVQVRWRLLRLA